MIGTLGELAARVGGEVRGDAATAIASIVAVDDAVPGALTFATDERFLRRALASKASAVLVDAGLFAQSDGAKPLLGVGNVRVALATLLDSLEPPRPPAGIDPSAAVDPTATIGADVTIAAQAVIGARARIGDRCIIGAGAIVGDDAVLGADCVLAPRAMLLHGCIAGARVRLQAGAVVGSDGFGWAFLDGRLRRIPQIGIVRLGDDVDIGANTCVDRAQTGATEIGNGTKIDNLVQIGHNCRIGEHCAFAAMTGLAGTTIVGDYVQVGGQSAFRGHITVGSRVKIAGNTMVWGNVPDDAFISGQPAQNHRDELRLQALIRKLPKLVERVDALEKERAAHAQPEPERR